MQEVQSEINDIKNNIYAGQYTEEEYAKKAELLKWLMNKLKRLSGRYKQLNRKTEKTEVNTKLLPKSQRVNEI